jgi:hypothetical protein
MLREFTLNTPQVSLNIAEGPENGPLLVLLHELRNPVRAGGALGVPVLALQHQA